ncbi:glycerol-3-phosphate dehydrogenase/oxidase [Viridibacillus arvi]|uniref:glycerol-3-phosphate dehydrogenase/oxidase n=1 Tax=Viridibacillus arvi TaxID=263475 RepID=UPI00187B90A5|nr:glycerol-3-phosphate dehydrogenase/oxidase [Viridibacillus sp. JNUCC-6]QOV10894.1 glycerol-3-phosphate dehydrogenase/oxidase [Viridibacillus sp. JNUCC-6]
MFSSAQRESFIETLDAYSFDVLVIGGGITGAGIALDAVSRGLSVALIDMQDFAAGTSSRSTKLVHGGLRYLKQLQVGVVAEVGKERAIVYENGVHITTPQWMLLPFYKGGSFGPYSTSLGLKVYDKLAQVNKSERRKMLNAKETLQKEPLLKKEGLLGGGYYVEYRTDDARLTIEVIKKAVELGAVCLNYVKAEEFKYENEKITGVVVRDQISSRTWTIQSNSVVNATGPWVDEVRKKDQISNNKQLRLTKGVHIVIDQSRFPLQQSVYFDTPDGRMVFAIPRDGKTYVGTTDTFYEENPINPVATDEDITYLIDTIHDIFPEVQITQKDVESSWAGVRPLIFKEGKDPSEISRKDEIWESPSGLLTIAGGKLTGYRKMAENIVDKIVEKKQFKKSGPCVTEHLSLSGAKGINPINFGPYVKNKTYEGTKLGLTKEEAHMLVSKYGTNIQAIFNIIHTLKVNNSVEDLPIAIHAQLLYAIQYEMAQTPADFFVRRSSRLLFDIDSVYNHKEAVVKLMKKYLSYSTAQEEQYRLELDQILFEASHFAKEDIYE